MDTVVWLANFPATRAFVMIFVGVMGAIFVGYRAVLNPGRVTKLERLRMAEGEDLPDRRRVQRAIGAVQQIVSLALTLVLVAGGVIAGLSMEKGPVTAGYIYDHGVRTTGTVEDDYVTFTASDGSEYHLHLDFFSPPTVPHGDLFLGESQFPVRYLEAHPQAFVIEVPPDSD